MIIWKSNKRVAHSDWITTGIYENNILLNSMVYEFEFLDKQAKEYSGSSIKAESMLSQVDSKAFSMDLLKSILENKKDDLSVNKSGRVL